MRVTVVNQSGAPQMLDDGTQLGAARTPEARREGVELSAGDRKRLVDAGLVRVIEPEREAGKTVAPVAARAEKHDTAKER